MDCITCGAKKRWHPYWIKDADEDEQCVQQEEKAVADLEKVTDELARCIKNVKRGDSMLYVIGPEDVKLLQDALELLRQRPMEQMLNLCDSCKNEFAECGADSITFGIGIGNDNVIGCNRYDNRFVHPGKWVGYPDRLRHWHCSECGSVWGITAKVMYYCPNCGVRIEMPDEWRKDMDA